mgnify:CR=1 FL=1
MHGSGENHKGYICRRTNILHEGIWEIPCDPMFTDSWNHVNSGINRLHDVVSKTLEELELNTPRPQRR